MCQFWEAISMKFRLAKTDGKYWYNKSDAIAMETGILLGRTPRDDVTRLNDEDEAW